MNFEEFIAKIGANYTRSEAQSLYRNIVQHLGENIDWQRICTRLNQHEPIDYIVGETTFFYLQFKVNRHVLIPRPETEELAELIVSENKHKKNLKILDLGTGSGCIAIALAKYLDAEVTAVDISPQALDVAKENATLNGVSVTFLQMDMLNPQETETLKTYDLIVSNPPYIPENESVEMDSNVLKYEPHEALFVPDHDALLFYRRIFEIAEKHLAPSGIIYCETSQTVQLLHFPHFQIEILRDMSGNLRFLKSSPSSV